MRNDTTAEPADELSQAPQTWDRGAASAFLDGPVNILIVDDEPKNLTVLETVLDDPGYRLVRAETADQALLALVVEEFALLILDIRMPGMTGFELAQLIKNRKKTAQVPIIFLTAYYNEDQHVLEGYGTGAVDYLHKPVNPIVLRSKAAVFVELHRKNRENELANRALLVELTARRRAEERLRELNETLDQRVIERSDALVESEERYRTLFNSMDEGFCIIELLFDENEKPIDYRHLEVNLAFEKQTGLEGARGRRMRELAPQHEQYWFDAYGRIALTGEPARFENRAAELGRRYEVYAFRVGRPANRHVGIVFNDITERIRAAEGLRASERRLRAIYDAIYEHLGLITPDGTLREVNRACLEFSGSKREEMIGLPLWDTAWFRYTPGVPGLVRDAIVRATAGESVRFETPIITPSGETKIFDISFHPVRDEKGEVTLLVPVGLDITERKGAEEALKEANRRKDEFLAMLAHELRNPLAPLWNGLQVMRLASGDADTVATAHAVMDRQLGHMVRLIDDLLDVARIGRNKMELRRSRVLLADVVDNALEIARPAIEEAGHELRVSLPAEPIFLDADLTRLAQVLSNLLTNSAKYTERGGLISLTAKRSVDEAVVAVRDTGIGIPANALPRVFEMFSQVDRSIERSTGGLGIGLALVRGLVEMHGGTVTAQSAGPGMGSTFTVRLPALGSVPEPVSTAPSEDIRPAAGSRRRILVVDDRHEAASTLAQVLTLLGNEVHTAHDGIEAVEAAEKFHPEVVLMDVGMPRLNGYEATRRIREQPWGRDAIIIALTGWGQEGDRSRSREAGFNAHLVKPLNLPDLDKLLTELTGR